MLGMKYNKAKKIADGVVENEFRHIQEYLENGFIDKDLEYKKQSEMTQALYEKLGEKMTEEQKDLLEELHTSISCEWIYLCRFYFEEGLRAGLGDLKFLSEIDFITNIL